LFGFCFFSSSSIRLCLLPHSSLISHCLGDQHDYKELLSEANDVEVKRTVCKTELDALHQAANVLLLE
jgi:hypothetical protein